MSGLSVGAVWCVVLNCWIIALAFLIPLLLCRLADIGMGIALAFKLENCHFEWRKFIRGVITTMIMIINFAFLIAGVVIIPELLAQFKLDINIKALTDTLNTIVFVTAIIGAAFSYGKDAYSKFLIYIRGEQRAGENPA